MTSDIYQLCALYKCNRCAGHNISYYDGKAFKELMGRCKGNKEVYYWHSRCNDSWKECSEGDDEDQNNSFCNSKPTPQVHKFTY